MDESTNDRNARDDLAGSLDYLFVGASHGLRAFIPSVIDEELNCNSYNLSGALMTFNGREAILNEELQRNDIKTVVIEISFDAFVRTSDEVEGNLYTVPRLAPASKRITYFIKNIDVFHYDLPYYYYFKDGMFALINNIRTNNLSNDQNNNKGYEAIESNDITLSDNAVLETLNSYSIDTTFRQNNIASFDRMVDSCRDNNTKVIVVVTPISDSRIWEVDNWNDFYLTLKDFCEERNIEVYDFNLLKNRYELFNDSVSYYDDIHLSDEGAHVFSREFSIIMNMVNNHQDVSSLFYSSYSQMKADSPYYK